MRKLQKKNNNKKIQRCRTTASSLRSRLKNLDSFCSTTSHFLPLFLGIEKLIGRAPRRVFLEKSFAYPSREQILFHGIKKIAVEERRYKRTTRELEHKKIQVPFITLKIHVSVHIFTSTIINRVKVGASVAKLT